MMMMNWPTACRGDELNSLRGLYEDDDYSRYPISCWAVLSVHRLLGGAYRRSNFAVAAVGGDVARLWCMAQLRIVRINYEL